MRKLYINQGQEFKLNIADSIDDDNVFYNEYQKAAEILNSMLTNMSQDRENNDENLENENNIIAFCGERGDGKSSAMMTFIHALKKYTQNRNNIKYASFWERYENIKNCDFIHSIVIDPSQFDETHNILDIVLATLYQAFKSTWRDRSDVSDCEEMIDQFSKVYRQVSLLSNPQKILDAEFDYEGDISKLNKLGETTYLKRSLYELINCYLNNNSTVQTKSQSKLLVAIDDLDLCSDNVYKMAEQIRKYLIIPNVIIIMAIKIPQLENCIREKNLKDYQMSLSVSKDSHQNVDLLNENRQGKNTLYSDIDDMTKRYVIKLIPIARRILMPKVRDMGDVEICYKDEEFNLNNASFGANIVELIREKTGIIFSTEYDEYRFLLPNSLRELVNLIVVLLNMKNPEQNKEVFRYNIKSLYNCMREYLEDAKEILFNEEMQVNNIAEINSMNFNANVYLNNVWMKIDKKEMLQNSTITSENFKSFFPIQKWFSFFRYYSYDLPARDIVYKLGIIYTFKLNELRYLEDDMELFSACIKDYIWGDNFFNAIPYSKKTQLHRARFGIDTITIYNSVMGILNPQNTPMQIPEDYNKFRIPKITNGKNMQEIVETWFLVSLITNSYTYENNVYTYTTNTPILYNNSIVNQYLLVSLENYIVGLCNLNHVSDKVNYDVLGADRGIVNRMIESCQQRNGKACTCARIICSNIDVMNELIVWCSNPNRRIKIKTASDELAIDNFIRFFKSVVDYLKTKKVEIDIEDLRYFKFSEDVQIDICELFSQLFREAEETQLRYQNQESPETSALRDRLNSTSDMLKNSKKMAVSTFLRDASAINAKVNIDKLINNIQRDRYLYPEKTKEIDVEGICKYYDSIIKLCRIDEKSKLSESQLAEYKEIVKIDKEL